MTFYATARRDWLANPRADVLAGIVVALALIPEAIGFSIIVGVDPRVGLYASAAIALVISFTGGHQMFCSAQPPLKSQGPSNRELTPRGMCKGHQRQHDRHVDEHTHHSGKGHAAAKP
jgi:hypothetical protein